MHCTALRDSSYSAPAWTKVQWSQRKRAVELRRPRPACAAKERPAMLNSPRTNRSQLLALAIAGVLATAANGADETDMWYVTPQAGYTLLDSSRNIDDDFHYGF